MIFSKSIIMVKINLEKKITKSIAMTKTKKVDCHPYRLKHTKFTFNGWLEDVSIRNMHKR